MLKKTRRLLFIASILVIAAIAVCVYLFLNSEPKTESSNFFYGTSNLPSYVNDSIADGKALFSANCASCHKMDRNLVGPALLGTRDRWNNNVKLLMQHIMNAKLVRRKSEYAKQLWLQYDKVECPDFTGVLTEQGVEAIMIYTGMIH